MSSAVLIVATAQVQRAVVYVHGSGEDPQTYFAALFSG